jgi:hypothetical protein
MQRIGFGKKLVAHDAILNISENGEKGSLYSELK